MSAPKATMEDAENAVLKAKCEADHLFFSRYFFYHRQSIKFLVNWHHIVIAHAIQRVIDGHCKNLVINVPPGSSKTELAVINFIARGLALNPRARFLHISSGDDLVLLNSQTARDIVSSEEYQMHWPLQIASDAKSKKRWNVVLDGKKAGGVYAVALGGQITGFRAGNMAPGFQGAIIIDDPLKADSAYSEAEVKKANRQLISTVKSRKANPATPVVVIMQRLAQSDCTGFIKGGNFPGKWEYVNIPALITDEYVAALSPEVRALVISEPRDDKGRFSYWQYKEHLDEMLEMEAGKGEDAEGNKVGKSVFHAQYMQAPTAIGGNIIKGEYFPRVLKAPQILYRHIFADTAQKKEQRHDYTVFECWGYGENKKIYLLDLLRGKWESPELKTKAKEFWAKNKAVKDMGELRKFWVEEKSSGTSLIQDIKREATIPMFPVIRGALAKKDKFTRVQDALPDIEAGFVCLIEGMPFNSDFVNECEAFTSDDSHDYDDQIDPLCDAVLTMLSKKAMGFFSNSWSVGDQNPPQ